LFVWFLFQDNLDKAILFAIGLGLGMALFYGVFGFSAAYRAAIVHREMSGIYAQIIMIGVATILFAPLLADGSASGAWAPVGVQVAIGSFLFGIGMQLGGACASGTLFTIGGGSVRMSVTLLFFCLGAFMGSLHLGWWSQLPNWGTQSLGHMIGWTEAVLVQLALFAAIFLLLKKVAKGRSKKVEWSLIICALVLAGLNYATLEMAGHPWTVTWAFTLWGAKVMTMVGWEAASSGFWSAPFQAKALKGSLLDDTTSLMNLAVVIGAFAAAFISARLKLNARFTAKSFIASVIGGLLMGYGARLAYGCNIGALFSGMASTSLHSWVWIICAMAGTWIGIQLRPFFGLSR